MNQRILVDGRHHQWLLLMAWVEIHSRIACHGGYYSKFRCTVLHTDTDHRMWHHHRAPGKVYHQEIECATSRHHSVNKDTSLTERERTKEETYAHAHPSQNRCRS